MWNAVDRTRNRLDPGLFAAIEDVAADLGLLDHVPIPVRIDVTRVIPQRPTGRIVHRAGQNPPRQVLTAGPGGQVAGPIIAAVTPPGELAGILGTLPSLAHDFADLAGERRVANPVHDHLVHL